MALKIQLRRDIAANWTANNPLLLNGEVGIETDTLKFKVGNGTQRWNALSSYALKPGEPNGVASLDAFGKVPLSQLPDQISLEAEAAAALQSALSTITTADIPEEFNLYFTPGRVVAATEGLYDIRGASAQALSSANSHTAAKFDDAIIQANTIATTKANQALALADQNSQQFTNTAINLLTTSDIEEGSRLYFTTTRVENIVGPLISQTRGYVDQEVLTTKNYIDTSLENFEAPSAISSTSELPEGSNLYFTNSRAVTATNAARTASLGAALGAVDELRTEIHQDLTNYVPLADINVSGGVAGLDAYSKIQDSAIPSTIARTSDITSAIANIVNLAPDSLNTLGELATAFQSDQTGLSALVTTVGTKLDSSLAATTYAPIDSPTFTGTVTLPAGMTIPGYATSINLSSALTEAKSYTDTAVNGINNSLGDYALISDRNIAGGYAGLGSDSKILESAIPTAIITSIAAAATLAAANINGTYTNGSSSSSINKITYGTNITPPSSGNAAGDIYIQY
jgi:hypothetical protein